MAIPENDTRLWKGFNGHGLYSKRAERDVDGNVIDQTYAKKAEVPELDDALSTSSTTAVTPRAVKAAIADVDRIPVLPQGPSSLYSESAGSLAWGGWETEEIDVPQIDFLYEFWSELAPVSDKRYFIKITRENTEYEYLDNGKNYFEVVFTNTPKIIEFDLFYSMSGGAINFGPYNSSQAYNDGSSSLIARPHYQLTLSNAMVFTRWHVSDAYPDVPTVIESQDMSQWETLSHYIPSLGANEMFKYLYSSTVSTGNVLHYKYELAYAPNRVKVSVSNGETVSYSVFSMTLNDIDRFHLELEGTSSRSSIYFKNFHIVY